MICRLPYIQVTRYKREREREREREMQTTEEKGDHTGGAKFDPTYPVMHRVCK